MAKKKPRTPPPPRRVQAPKTRTGPSRTASRTSRTQPTGVALGEIGMRQRAILYGVALSGVVALVAVVIIVVVAGGGSGAKAAIKAIRAAGGVPTALFLEPGPRCQAEPGGTAMVTRLSPGPTAQRWV